MHVGGSGGKMTPAHPLLLSRRTLRISTFGSGADPDLTIARHGTPLDKPDQPRKTLLNNEIAREEALTGGVAPPLLVQEATL